MTTIRSRIFDGKAIIPDEPVNLPLNRPLTVVEGRAIEKARREPACGPWPIHHFLGYGLADRADIGDSVGIRPPASEGRRNASRERRNGDWTIGIIEVRGILP